MRDADTYCKRLRTTLDLHLNGLNEARCYEGIIGARYLSLICIVGAE